MKNYNLINQRATTCKHGGHCEWIACDKCSHYEPDVLNQQPCEDCRNCKEWNRCPCGKEGHENGTSIGYSIGECKNYEPCDDCISRQEALNVVHKYFEHYLQVNDDICLDGLRSLPSVTPKEKTGHWKEVYAETDYRNGWIEFTCENCEYQHGLESGQYGWHYGDEIPWKYCPICGAKMIEPQESENKE